MAEVEPMDVESDFEDKENSLHLNNVLTRASFTEKGYEELDVSEISMKLRYSTTPCASPMSKSYVGCYRDSKVCDTSETNESLINGNINLTHSLNSTLTNFDNKGSKLTPLQPLTADTLEDINRNPLGRHSLDPNLVDRNLIITLNDNDPLDNLSLPSASSSNSHTPEIITPTKEMPKDDGSPIMRGLKSVFSMFRSSQSPIPPPESSVQTNILNDSPSSGMKLNQLATISTPISAHKAKDTSPKRNSPLKDSIVFKEDLEKELLWKDETTIIFKEEKIPISKLVFQQTHSNHLDVKQNEFSEKMQGNTSVEYMDISPNDSAICNKTMTDLEPKTTLSVTEMINNNESDGEFVDCETTFTKNELDTSQLKTEFEQSHAVSASKETNDYKYSVDKLEMEQGQEETTDLNQNGQRTEDEVKNPGIDKKEIKNKQDILESTQINQEAEDQIKNNQGITEAKFENDAELSEIQIMKEAIPKDIICDNNTNESVVTNITYCGNSMNTTVMYDSTKLNQGKQSNYVNETSKIEDCSAQNQSSICIDKLCLLKHSDTSDIDFANTTKEIEHNNTLPINEIVHVTNTSLLQTTPDKIDKAINLSVNDNKTLACSERNSSSEFGQVIKEIVLSELVSNIDNNLNTMTSDSVEKDFSLDKKILQNSTAYTETSTLDEIIKNVNLCEIVKSQETDINDAIGMCDEELGNLITSEITDLSQSNKTHTETSSIIPYLSSEHFVVPTDISLPSHGELEQDTIIEKNKIEKGSNTNLKVNISDHGRVSPNNTNCADLYETLISKINLESSKNIFGNECHIEDQVTNNLNSSIIVSKFDNIDQNFMQNDAKPINVILDKAKENDSSVHDGTSTISEKESVNISIGDTVEAYEQQIQYDVVKNQDSGEYQIISGTFNLESDIKIQAVNEIITSASNSPYVSVTDLSLSECDEDDLGKINNTFQITELIKSLPSSPKPIKKSYDINFDDIEDPFATKTRIRLSPPPETPYKKSLPSNNTLKKKIVDKKYDDVRNKLKSQQRKATKITKNLSANLDFAHKYDSEEKLKTNKLCQIDLLETDIDSNIETESENKNSEINLTNNIKIETSNKQFFNPTYVSSDNMHENKKNQQIFNVNLSGRDVNNKTIIQGDKNSLNNFETMATVSNFNDSISCDINAKEHKLLGNKNIYNEALEEDAKNKTTVCQSHTSQDVKDINMVCQSDINTTVDLLKDIKTQESNIKCLNTSKYTQNNIQSNVMTHTTLHESGDDNVNCNIPIISNHKTFTTDVSKNMATDHDLENETIIIAEGKNSMVIDINGTNLSFEKEHTVDKLKGNLTTSDSEKLYSMTELILNHNISDVKDNSTVTDLKNETSVENDLKSVLKEKFEIDLTVKAGKKFTNESVYVDLIEKKSENNLCFETKKDNAETELFDVKQSILNINADIVAETNEIADTQSIENETEDGKVCYTNISVSTSSSKNTNDNTVREIHTEDEDTVEGSYFETDEYSDQMNVQEFDTINKITEFNLPPPLTNIESTDSDELFIDAEAFEFLLNQNKSNIIADSGKESLFLKFDPLFAKRLSSDYLLTALNEIQKRQSTPKKLPQSSGKIQIESPQPGPSKIDALAEEAVDHIEIPSIAKPMMVVNPAVNTIPSPRKVTPKLNRHSLTFTSPAIAVIDRLLSLSGNNSLIDQNASSRPQGGRGYTETDIAITQLRELLAEKEIHVHNLRCESKELKDRLANLEDQMKSLETESGEKLKKINTLNECLAEKTKINRSMALVVEEYERTIASLISDIEQDKKCNAEERMKLIRERDEQTAHLASMEVSFNDLHSKYEKSKQIILSMKANEDKYKKSLQEFEDSLAKMHSNYEFLKQHATSKLNHANQELEKINRAHESEVLKLNALIKRKELHITSLEETLTQKTKANEELTAICDDLINKVG